MFVKFSSPHGNILQLPVRAARLPVCVDYRLIGTCSSGQSYSYRWRTDRTDSTNLYILFWKVYITEFWKRCLTLLQSNEIYGVNKSSHHNIRSVQKYGSLVNCQRNVCVLQTFNLSTFDGKKFTTLREAWALVYDHEIWRWLMWCDLLSILQRGAKCSACPAPGRRRREGYTSLPPGLKGQWSDGSDSGSRVLFESHSQYAHTSRNSREP
jgi:hypothetical protein